MDWFVKRPNHSFRMVPFRKVTLNSVCCNMEVYANTLMLIQMCESEWGGYSSLIYKQCLNVKVAHLVKYLQNIHLIRPPVGISQFIQQGATSTCHQLSLWQLLCTVYTVSCNSTASVFVHLPCADLSKSKTVSDEGRIFWLSCISMSAKCEQKMSCRSRPWASASIITWKRRYSFRWTTPGEKKS